MIKTGDTVKIKENYDDETKRMKCEDFLQRNYWKKDKKSTVVEGSTVGGSDATSFMNKILGKCEESYGKKRVGLSRLGEKKSGVVEKSGSF
jgi:hypothetical protein